ncbi:MAG: nitroreductase family protein [Candidatus Paceibacteria bacterium]
MENERKPEYKINEVFLNRWSPRAMSGEALNEEELMPLIEAAKWAPSSYNNQPWRFFYSLKDDENWQEFLNLLVEFNQSWAKNAGALIVLVSKKTFDDGSFSKTHSFDTGSAWENFALQGSENDLVVHAMQAFDYEKAHELLSLPEEYEVEAMIAVGKPGPKENLPEAIQDKDVPSGRKSISEISTKGKFQE